MPCMSAQRKFLSEQLKTVMNRSRVLESELQAYGYEGSVGGRSVSSHTLVSQNANIVNSGRRTGTGSNNNNINTDRSSNSRLKYSKSLPALEQAHSPTIRKSIQSKGGGVRSSNSQSAEQLDPLRSSSTAGMRKQKSLLNNNPINVMNDIISGPYEPLLNPNAKSFDETQSKHHGTALAALQNKR
jgi:hypothetical protein